MLDRKLPATSGVKGEIEMMETKLLLIDDKEAFVKTLGKRLSIRDVEAVTAGR